MPEADAKPWLRYHATCGGHHVHDGPALDLRGVTVAYPGQELSVLRGLDFTLSRKVSAALLGANGAGKSTLLKAVAGLLPLGAGEVSVLGHGVGRCHHQVAYLPQHQAIDWDYPMSVRRFVLTGSYIRLGWFRRPGKALRAAADAMLERLQLAPLARRRINELSGGQQQRLLLARTLLHGADLLLLDEPFNAVDAENRALLRAALRELKTEGKTILTATHELDFGADFFDVRYRLEDGQLREEVSAS